MFDMKWSKGSVQATLHRLVGAATVAVIAAGLLAACGSSKPAYCSAVTNFESSVKQLKAVGSPSALVTQLKKVSSTANTAIVAVKSSFAPQTSAVKSSLAALERSVTQLASSSTRASALAAIPADVTAVKTAGQNLASSAKSCS
jgi:hypothetical protein